MHYGTLSQSLKVRLVTQKRCTERELLRLKQWNRKIDKLKFWEKTNKRKPRKRKQNWRQRNRNKRKKRIKRNLESKLQRATMVEPWNGESDVVIFKELRQLNLYRNLKSKRNSQVLLTIFQRKVWMRRVNVLNKLKKKAKPMVLCK